MANMEPSSLLNLQKFYSSDKYSDITVKSRGLILPAHRIILAQHSVYFKRAFLGCFPVASSRVIDLGEDDEPDMVRAMIRFMYDGRWVDYNRLPGENVVEAMVNMFVLADKYDVEGLRALICNDFTRAVDLAFSDLGKNITHQHHFITSIVPRICGPSALQLADKILQQSILNLCKMHWTTLFLNTDFCTLHGTGQLFDCDHAAEFGRYLGLLFDESDKHNWNKKKVRLDLWRQILKPRIEPCFEAFYDVQITYGDGRALPTSRILLAIHSPYFDDMLEHSSVGDRIPLDREDDPEMIELMLHEVSFPDCTADLHDLKAFTADMCVLTQKYDLQDANFRHRFQYLEDMKRRKCQSSYPLAVALVCGPNSSEYADTNLPEQVFKRCIEDAKTLVKENKTFLRMLEEGTLFNAKFAGRFAAGLAGYITEGDITVL